MPLTRKQKEIINNEVTLHKTRLLRAKDANNTDREMDALRGRLHQRFSELQKSHERREARISKQNSPGSSMKNMLEKCVENLLVARIAELSLTKSIIETGGHSQSNLRTTLRIAEKAIDFNNRLIQNMKTIEKDTEKGPTTDTLGPNGLRGPVPFTPHEVETAESLFRSYARPAPNLKVVCHVLPSTQTEAAPLSAPLEAGEDVTPKV